MKINEPNYDWAYALTPRSLTTHLILHHAAAVSETPEAIHAYHKSKGWAGIAYHYYVRKDGTVYRGRPEAMRGGHTTNWNYCSIGVCFEGNFETETMPEAQIKAGQELVADIKARYPNIIIGRHSDYQATACPGKRFPFEEMLKPLDSEPGVRDAEDDGKADPWAVGYTDRAAGLGLFVGDENGNFHWKDYVTRQELAAVMIRLMEKTEK